MRKLAFFLGVVFLGACSPSPVHVVPDNLIEKEKLISILVDLQVLESHFQREFSRVDLYKQSLDSSSVAIFESYQISRADFKGSIDYYATYPDTLFIIYEAVLDTISYRITTIQSNE